MTTPLAGLRLANAKDAHAIAALSRKTFFDTFAAHNTAANMELFMNGPFSEANLVAEVENEDNFFLVIEQNNRLLAYARVLRSTAPPELADLNAVEIGRIYVLKDAIGMGLGKKLMEGCVALARQHGKDWIWLGVWEHNHRAIAFYKRWGFEKFGEHVFMLGEDAQTDWLMKKQL